MNGELKHRMTLVEIAVITFLPSDSHRQLAVIGETCCSKQRSWTGILARLVKVEGVEGNQRQLIEMAKRILNRPLF